MTKAIFTFRNQRCTGFNISGHSGYSDEGSDIVCAAVSAMAMLCANTVTEFFGCNADANAESTRMTLRVNCKCHSCDELLRSFMQELVQLSHDYPENLAVYKITDKE